jgi:hypothetical protein
VFTAEPDGLWAIRGDLSSMASYRSSYRIRHSIFENVAGLNDVGCLVEVEWYPVVYLGQHPPVSPSPSPRICHRGFEGFNCQGHIPPPCRQSTNRAVRIETRPAIHSSE